jgi:hypothetical protein
MSLKKDQQFSLPKITRVDYKSLEMDRVITMLLPRLEFKGLDVRRSRSEFTTKMFVDEFLKEDFRERFNGFDRYREIVHKWIETDLMDMINRGKPDQVLASPRPLHGSIYKFRNGKHARDYGAASQIYWMLFNATGVQGVLEALKRFFFTGIDPNLKQQDPNIEVDVETQALLQIDLQVTIKNPDTKEEIDRSPSLCRGQENLMAEDVMRLLAYEHEIPRSVMVEYLKILLAFHLALYHLRVMKLLPTLVNHGKRCDACKKGLASLSVGQPFPDGGCPHTIGLVVDMGDPGNSHIAELSRRSADAHYRRIPDYVRAHFALKKLEEMATELKKQMKYSLKGGNSFTVDELLELLQPKWLKERDAHFKGRMHGLTSTLGEDKMPEIQQLLGLGLSEFDAFVESLTLLRGKFHRKYITQCLDSLLLKNTDAGLLRQGRTRNSARRFVLGSKLLEVLLQVVVLTPESGGFRTREIRVDELLEVFRTRYGLYIDQLPADDGVAQATIVDHNALRRNAEAFKMRLREIGFFQDLSDAYITQTVTPRYTITPPTS